LHRFLCNPRFCEVWVHGILRPMLAPTLLDLSTLDREALQTLLLAEHQERLATQQQLLEREQRLLQRESEKGERGRLFSISPDYETLCVLLWKGGIKRSRCFSLLRVRGCILKIL
jgi:hypothetical protein